MDVTKENVNPNPRERANVFQVTFFTYTIDMFRKGYQKALDVDDLYNPLKADRSVLLGDRLEKKWKKHIAVCTKRNKKPSLLRVLFATFWPEYLYLGFLLAIMDLGLRLIQPLMLGRLLDYFKPNQVDTTYEEALWYAGAVVGVNAFAALIINQYIIGAFHYGMKVRAACCSVIYRKSLRLSRSALAESASGKVVNLLSNDVSRFDIVSVFIHHMWVAPLSAVIVTYFLWAEAGWAGIVGIVPVFVVVPLQSYTGKLSSIFRRQTAYKTDERVRLMDEIISGIQVIKMYAWEKPFAKLIKFARLKEVKIITKLSYVRGLFMTFNLFTTRAALFVSLLAMVLLGIDITASRVFVFMCYFNILSQTMSSMFVRGISEIAESLVAIKRLEEYLMQGEYVKVQQKPMTSKENNNSNGMTASNGNITSSFTHSSTSNSLMALQLEDITSKWELNNTENTLSAMTLTVPKGALLGVIGPVGSGKSSLLQTFLGEMNITVGNITINGSLSYACQEAWVFGATVRQNILFGTEYHKKKYNEVIRVCSLEKDFEQFEDGDRTIVGDRGSSLSGGQKARINLARAVYRDADIYMLDDPLSAVDIHVAKHIYDECINGYLKNKTRILVTHQVHHLKNADKIIILKNGTIELEGTFSTISGSSNVEYARLLSKEPESTDEETQKMIENMKNQRKLSCRSKSVSISSAQSETSLVDSSFDDAAEDVKTKDLQEESSKGKIKGSLFMKYMLAGGNCFFVFIVLFLYLFTQIAASGVDYFVSFWTNVEEARNLSALNQSHVLEEVKILPSAELLTTETYLYIYGSLTASLFVIALLRSLLFYKLAMLSSRNLHDSMFDSIVAAPMLFFEKNSSGRILNRFSKDIGNIDELLPKGILDAAQIILLMIGSLLLVAVVNPYFLVPVFCIGIVFFFLRVIFLKSSKNIKRLEGILRSPVFTHLNATLEGLTTIRAYGAQNILKQEFDKHQDLHTSAWYMYISACSAFGFYLDLLCFIFTGFVTFSFLVFGDSLLGGQVGLAITQASALTGLVQWGMRQSAEVTNQLMSVERVLEYNQLEPEKQPLKPKMLPNEWPKEGELAFKNMGLRYGMDDPLVLKNLTFTIKPQEKIGIVGRTGAGKSSLISALFRLATVEGEIEIDGIDTGDVVLQYLRSKIAIIPQDPVLFSGTLRYNLDPFEEYKDDELYRAIGEVELKDPSNLINRLESRVMDRGSNYSVGQRQLICLARAIVRRNRILMLDEATANVDPQTDALIQKTIRRKFADCTVLTVAHRLNTIMDSDRVLVMDAGTMAEFDHPYRLLKNPSGRFAKMVAQSGRAQAEQLRRIAIQSYVAKHEVPEEIYL